MSPVELSVARVHAGARGGRALLAAVDRPARGVDVLVHPAVLVEHRALLAPRPPEERRAEPPAGLCRQPAAVQQVHAALAAAGRCARALA